LIADSLNVIHLAGRANAQHGSPGADVGGPPGPGWGPQLPGSKAAVAAQGNSASAWGSSNLPSCFSPFLLLPSELSASWLFLVLLSLALLSLALLSGGSCML